MSREEIQEQETVELINKLFDGSVETFFSAFINEKNLTKADIERLKEIVDKLSGKERRTNNARKDHEKIPLQKVDGT